MAYTDSDLALIEMITYINDDVLKAAGINPSDYKVEKPMSIEDILAVFDKKALEKLRQNEKAIDGALTSGKEWANLIENLQGRKDLCALQVYSTYTNGKTKLAITYVDPNKKALGPIVTFKGTSGPEEWNDNVIGMNTADTPCQEAALDYVNTLVEAGFNNITVVGHSKGANKAMYVTIRCNQIVRCVALDGQGLSIQFINKYADEIKKRARFIKNISLEDDFVHILLMQLMGIDIKFVQGYGVDSFAENHSPNSFFATDELGDLITTEDGELQMTFKKMEGKEMTILSNFVKYIMQNASAEDLQKIVAFLGPVLAKAMGEGKLDDIKEMLVEDPEMLAMIIGMLFAYMDENDISFSDFDDLLAKAGLKGIKKSLLLAALKALKKSATDGKENDGKFLNWTLEKLMDYLGVDEEIARKVLDGAEATAMKYKEVADNGIVRDYTDVFRNKMISIVDSIESEQWYQVSKWDIWYRGEDFFNHLDISNYTDDIDSFYRKKMDIEGETKSGIIKIFNDCVELDGSYSSTLEKLSSSIETCTALITEARSFG